jgi:hypothetical protein
MPSATRHPYRSWNRSWLAWLFVNLVGATGAIAYASATSADLGYPIGICVAAAVGSALLLPVMWFVLASTLDCRYQGGRLLVFWGAILSTYLGISLLMSALGGFFGIIALFTGWPYLPAVLVGVTLAYKEWLFRGNDREKDALSVNKLA